jgi:hypothetical protein
MHAFDGIIHSGHNFLCLACNYCGFKLKFLNQIIEEIFISLKAQKASIHEFFAPLQHE